MTRSCARLSALPEKELAQKSLEETWGGDVQAYERCRLRHIALRDFYRKRDAALRMSTPEPGN